MKKKAATVFLSINQELDHAQSYPKDDTLTHELLSTTEPCLGGVFEGLPKHIGNRWEETDKKTETLEKVPNSRSGLKTQEPLL